MRHRQSTADAHNCAHVVRRYHPLIISITAAAMGAGFSIPMTFLRPFAVEAHLNNVGLFFVVYACVAFAARVATASHFSRLGNRLWIIVGLSLMTISFLCYIPVTQTWHLIFPGAIAGVAHALLFPSVMAAGTAAFPAIPGIATSADCLATFDIGVFLGAPIIGAFIREAKHHTTAAYPITFAATSVAIGCVTVLFCCSSVAQIECHPTVVHFLHAARSDDFLDQFEDMLPPPPVSDPGPRRKIGQPISDPIPY